MTIAQFHLAFPVRDLEEARRFYLGTIGCELGREDANHIDFNMFGHHVVAHIAPGDRAALGSSKFDGHDVPIPHFGLNLTAEDWGALAARLVRDRADFREYPHVRLAGQVGEHDTMFVYDPSGNSLEFKAFRDPSQVFALDLMIQGHQAPDRRVVVRPMIEAEVFRVAGGVAEELVGSGLLDSIKAFELLGRLRQVFGLALGDVTMRELSTVTAIADLVCAAERSAAP